LGSIQKVQGESNYIISGRMRVKDKDTLEITELPPNKSIRDYKTFLEKMIESGEVKALKEFHTEN
jgi:hypothetical protein